jgi:hypothetical protein
MGRLFRALLIVFSTCFLAAGPVQVSVSAELPWKQVGVGIDYTVFHLSGPNQVHVARMDRTNPQTTIESSIARGRLSGGFETVSGMADRYEQSISYWGQKWGARNDVVVAINGSFYNTSTGVPRGGVIHSGWYAKRFDDLSGESGFAWTVNKEVFIGRCVSHPSTMQLVQFVSGGSNVTFDGINFERNSNDLILYTPQYNSNTGTDDNGLEIVVEMKRPTLILPDPYMAKGFVREIRPDQGSTLIPFDHIVISAHGTARTALGALNVGDEIGVSQEIAHYEAGCGPPTWTDWTKTYASISGSFHYLRNGVIHDYSHDLGALERHPRTAIAYDDDYIYFIVVDGRNPGISIGMTIVELATFTRDVLGADWGIAQDGGGSSTMVINGKVVNFPNAEHFDEMLYFPMTRINRYPDLPKDVSGSLVGEPIEFTLKPPGPENAGFERYVANGMMMVVIEDKEVSSNFSPADQVRTIWPTEIRLGPGSNYPGITTLPANSTGTVLDHLNDLEGVFAKGEYWWKVSVSGIEGWIPESAIVLAGS